MHDEAAWGAIGDDDKVSARGIEVGHIFHFGDKYSKPMGAKVAGPDGKEHLVSMGSYGIGPSRLIAAIIEASHDENGIIWPDSVSPFDVALINMKAGDAACDGACETPLRAAFGAGLEVLYDDTDQRPGGKFATADLIGLPWQVNRRPRALPPARSRSRTAGTGERRRCPSTPSLPVSGRPYDGDSGSKPPARRRGRLFGLRAHGGLALPALAQPRDCGSVIASISFIGIMLGVATLIIVMAVMNGLSRRTLDAHSRHQRPCHRAADGPAARGL